MCAHAVHETGRFVLRVFIIPEDNVIDECIQITSNYGFIISRRRQDDSSISGSPTLSVPLAWMQEALRVCLQFDPRGTTITGILH